MAIIQSGSIKRGAFSPNPLTVFPLDDFPGSAFDYLFYKGRSDYEDTIITASRSKDGATMNVASGNYREFDKLVYDWRAMRTWANPNRALRTEAVAVSGSWARTNADQNGDTVNWETSPRGSADTADFVSTSTDLSLGTYVKGKHNLIQTINKPSVQQNMTFSLDVKSYGGANVTMNIESDTGGVYAEVDLQNGVIQPHDIWDNTWGVGFTNLRATIKRYADYPDWYTVSISCETDASSFVYIIPSITDESFNGTFLGKLDFGVIMCAAQLEPGLKVTEYVFNGTTPGSEYVSCQRHYSQGAASVVSYVENLTVTEQPILWDYVNDIIRDGAGRLTSRNGDTISTGLYSLAHGVVTSAPVTIYSRILPSDLSLNRKWLSDNNVRLMSRSGGIRVAAVNNIDISPLTLQDYLVTVLFAGANSEVYLNGSLAKTGDTGVFSIDDIIVGNRSELDQAFDGLIGDMLIFFSDNTTNREAIEAIL